MITALDHTELDIELVSSVTGQPLGRPWATLLLDAYSRRILAVYVTYDAPSYRSAMMALRLCVQRHQRLPQEFVVDRGPEFGSVYFETLLAQFLEDIAAEEQVLLQRQRDLEGQAIRAAICGTPVAPRRPGAQAEEEPLDLATIPHYEAYR
jgi:transposase InsO family protein